MLGDGITTHNAAKLCLFGTRRHDDFVEITLASGLVEQGNIGDGEGVTGLQRSEPLVSPCANDRMNDLFEIVARGWIAERDCAQFASIERAVLVHDTRSEARDDGGKAG